MPTRQTDPSGFWGSVVALIEAVLALAVVFGVPLPAGAEVAILGVLVAAGPVLTQLLIRRDAWSPAAHEAAVQLTRYAGPTEPGSSGCSD